jgi:hypothetical protein
VTELNHSEKKLPRELDTPPSILASQEPSDTKVTMEMSRRANRVANAVLSAFLVPTATIAAFAGSRMMMSSQNSGLYPLALVVSTGLVGCLLYLILTHRSVKVNVALVLPSLAFPVLLMEFFLTYFHNPPHVELAHSAGIPFDRRTKWDVLQELRDQGLDAYPNYHPAILLETPLRSQETAEEIFPIGTISHISTILPNENGFYPLIATDRYGFNNPDSVYHSTPDIVIVGDSFAAGASVSSDESIAGVLRSHGHKVLNLGKIGNGPLLEYVTLREYGRPFEPPTVLWLFHASDIESNLSKELDSKFLQNYTNDSRFSQNLISRQAEIDGVLRHYLAQLEDSHFVSFLRTRFGRIFLLPKLRHRLGLDGSAGHLNVKAPGQDPNEVVLMEAFVDVLKRSDRLVGEWGGNLYFVYLPSYGRYTGRGEHPIAHSIARAVDVPSEIGLRFIDLHSEVFQNEPDKLSLFPFRTFQHYNAEGYRRAADAIDKRLRADGREIGSR